VKGWTFYKLVTYVKIENLLLHNLKLFKSRQTAHHQLQQKKKMSSRILSIITKTHFISYSCHSLFNSSFLFANKRLNSTRLLTNTSVEISRIKPIKKIAVHNNPKLNLENRMTIYIGPLSLHVRKYKRLALLFCTCGFFLVPSIYIYGKAPIIGAVGGKFRKSIYCCAHVYYK
jgi:hypothetical protein